MNSDATIIRPRFTYTEKAYVPNTSNVFIIVEETMKLMENYFKKSAPAFQLVNNLRFDYPETSTTYDEIHICCMDTSWSQIVFQFSHEFCHLLIGNPVPPSMRWFEESVCELASLFFLEKLAIIWGQSGLLAHPEYAPSLISYRTNRINSVEDLKNPSDLSDPSSAIWKDAIANCYNRNFNLQIAKLLLPVFSKYPQLWETVPLLGRLPAQDSVSFPMYLGIWRILAGDSYKQPLNELASIFHCSI